MSCCSCSRCCCENEAEEETQDESSIECLLTTCLVLQLPLRDDDGDDGEEDEVEELLELSNCGDLCDDLLIDDRLLDLERLFIIMAGILICMCLAYR